MQSYSEKILPELSGQWQELLRLSLSGVVRSVKVKLVDPSLDSQKVLRRPICKIVLLVEDESVQFPDEGIHR